MRKVKFENPYVGGHVDALPDSSVLKGYHFPKKKDMLGIYQILNDVHNIFVKHKITYWIDAGTMLGAVRHQGLIPWDDDADICMPKEELPKLLSEEVAEDLMANGYKISTHQEIYKISAVNGRVIYQHGKKLNHAYPFLDIFTVEEKKDKKVHYVGQWAIWSKAYFHWKKDLFPLQLTKFGAIKLYMAKNPKEYLNRAYPGWDEKACTPGWNHELEKKVKKIYWFKLGKKDRVPGKDMKPIKKTKFAS